MKLVVAFVDSTPKATMASTSLSLSSLYARIVGKRSFSRVLPAPAAPPSTPVALAVVKPIRPPKHYHIYWPALRARAFARILTGIPMWRGTYDQNIRMIAERHLAGCNPREFIQTVNPFLFAKQIGLSELDARRLLGRSYHELWTQAAYSRCEHCRALALT